VIRNIGLADAGLYTASDEIHALRASANLTVIGLISVCCLLYDEP